MRGGGYIKGGNRLEVRGGHRCGWGCVGGKFRLVGVRGWQLWWRDEQLRGLEVSCCQVKVFVVMRWSSWLTLGQHCNPGTGSELGGGYEVRELGGRYSHPVGSRKGGPDYS